MSFCNRQICPECGGADCELAQEIARFNAALKPVLECDLGSPNQMAAWGAVREAQRIAKEGGAK